MDFITYLTRQITFSRGAFGPARRHKGVVEHIKKELEELEDAGGSPDEWVDLVMLSLDGLTRAVRERLREGTDIMQGFEPTHDRIARDSVAVIVGKLAKNELRDWPDWRTASEDQAIEHDRSKDNELG
ncbi:MAG: DUF550 domain-containing protein [Planctomycetales bacterium]|nr:DUF550 domain-containing protein [Planctomycetales bacterium]